MYSLPKLFLFAVSLCCLTLGTGIAYAQHNISVKGQVIDAGDNKPLPGATIEQIKGAAKAVTDENGIFEISVPAGSQLRITNVGYQ